MIIFSEPQENLQYVFNQRLSDHKPLIAEGFLIWNILCLSKVINNGFRMDETLENREPYKRRLKEVALLINKLVDAEKLSGRPIEVLCLQEVPLFQEDLDIFFDALCTTNFDFEFRVLTQTGFHKFQNLTLYSKYYSGRVITSDLKVPDDCQKNRYQILELIHKETKKTHRIGNVHFGWHSSKEKNRSRKATQGIIKTLLLEHHCSLMGDFNQSLSWMFEDPNIQNHVKALYYPKDNSMAFSEVGAQSIYGQVDALILI